MKREYRLTVKCAKPGCTEYAHYRYDTKADYRDGYQRHNGKWLCTRHTDESKVLSVSKTENQVRKEYVCVALEQINNHHFWNGTNGYAHGDAFKAWAEDFPVGTKIIVESKATVILP